jgi:hypothetical protein
MTLLSQSSAITSGHDLWVLPHYKTSTWTPQIDWMMNFQILKTSRHRPPEVSSALVEILHQNEIHVHNVEINTDELLIPTQLFFSNRWVLYCSNMINSEGEVLLNHWFKSIFHHWKGLKFPSLRIFLPQGVNIQEVQKIWNNIAKESDGVAFVVDTTSSSPR